MTEILVYVPIGLGLGAAGVFLWLWPQLGRADRRCAELEDEVERARKRIKELTSSTADAFDAVARRLDEGARGVEHSVEARSSATAELWSALEPLGDGHSPDPERVDRVTRQAENAAAAVSAGVREISAEVASLERASRFVAELTSVMDGNQRDREEAEALGEAASETIVAAAAMDEAIRRVQDTAGETATLSAKVSTEAERGYRAVHRTLDEIERIRDLTEAARERIDALGDRVEGIGDVVRVIQEITEKTNLLALNASIIAAQAGQHGRSFAVVAREIKALANRTAASTKQISEQIRGVQDETARATSAMVHGTTAVNEGFQVAIAAGDALGAIRESARMAQKRVHTMTRAYSKQAKTTRQVVDLAGRVSERAQAFAAAVKNNQTPERLAAVAGELGASVGRLNDLLAKQTSAAGACADSFGVLLSEVADLTHIERDLRGRLDEMRSGVGTAHESGAELASQLDLVRTATSQLRNEIMRLQTA